MLGKPKVDDGVFTIVAIAAITVKRSIFMDVVFLLFFFFCIKIKEAPCKLYLYVFKYICTIKGDNYREMKIVFIPETVILMYYIIYI